MCKRRQTLFAFAHSILARTMSATTSGNPSAWSVASPLHNRLAPEDRPIHAWYRFVLSFPPHLVRRYIEDFELQPGSLLLDPFCGTGTTLVEAKKHGISSIGVEANPLAAFASEVKTDWSASADLLAEWGERIVAAAEEACAASGVSLASYRRGAVSETRSLFGLMTLDEVQAGLLLRGSISPLPLHRCLLLRELIGTAPRSVRNHLLLALAWTVVSEAGNLRFGPEVGITRPKEDADVFGAWHQHVQRMADDVKTHSGFSNVPCVVIRGDARDLSSLDANSVNAVFTSPPYPNEKDYTRTTRLESVLLGFLRSKTDLRGLKEGLLRSNTRNVFVSDTDDVHVDGIAEIQKIARRIEARRIELQKTSGFERLYHRVTKLYFGGMARHLSALRHCLKPGAMVGYVVGDQASYLRVKIHTARILAGMAERLGYQHVRTDLFRTRLATATREQLREEVLVLRWNG